MNLRVGPLVHNTIHLMVWCCMALSEVGHCRWNCQCDQMHRYTAEVRGDRFIRTDYHAGQISYHTCLELRTEIYVLGCEGRLGSC